MSSISSTSSTTNEKYTFKSKEYSVLVIEYKDTKKVNCDELQKYLDETYNDDVKIIYNIHDNNYNYYNTEFSSSDVKSVISNITNNDTIVLFSYSHFILYECLEISKYISEKYCDNAMIDSFIENNHIIIFKHFEPSNKLVRSP
jgi:hypothetical protein